MQEYEDRQEGDVCGNCKFYKTRTEHEGLCSKQWRKAQTHDTATRRTNWCEHFEKDAMMEEATPVETAEEEFEDKAPNAYPSYGPVEAEAVIRELKLMLAELVGFKETLDKQLVSAAETDNMPLLVETKGMIRVVSNVALTVTIRINSIIPMVGKSNG